jgi:hypothetical protein
MLKTATRGALELGKQLSKPLKTFWGLVNVINCVRFIKDYRSFNKSPRFFLYQTCKFAFKNKTVPMGV